MFVQNETFQRKKRWYKLKHCAGKHNPILETVLLNFWCSKNVRVRFHPSQSGTDGIGDTFSLFFQCWNRTSGKEINSKKLQIKVALKRTQMTAILFYASWRWTRPGKIWNLFWWQIFSEKKNKFGFSHQKKGALCSWSLCCLFLFCSRHLAPVSSGALHWRPVGLRWWFTVHSRLLCVWWILLQLPVQLWL